MKKLIAITALASLLAAGCAREKSEQGGGMDNTGTMPGTSSMTDTNDTNNATGTPSTPDNQ
jgi:hypothetical protein